MTTPAELRLNGTVIRYDASVLASMEPKLFDASWLRTNGIWQGSSKGRSQAHFFHHAGRDMVLRHFQRGGLMGRVNRDLYLRVGAKNSRPMREFDLLADMRAEGLPVPAPVAAQYAPVGAFYRADIITQRIPQARPLEDMLSAAPLSAQLWRKVGAQIRHLHDHEVYHSDLNCRNILMDAQDRIWFIDFDKCEKRTPGPWQQATLERLQRSLRKTASGAEVAHWREEDWPALLAGYAEGEAAVG